MAKLSCRARGAPLGAYASLLGLLTPLPVWANAGPTSTPAQIVAEPTGITNVAITRETLTIDLRSVAEGRAAQVEAVYQLHNPGPERKLDLLFAFGSPANSNFQVSLDGQTVAGVPVQAKGFRMPASWMPPQVTPGLQRVRDLEYGGGWSVIEPVAFTVAVRPGPATLKVRYQAGVKITYARPAMYRQFAYVLAPARSWAGFGGLDVTVYLPDGWSVASTPVLAREGDLLRGTFAALPADAIALTFRPPVPSGYLVVTYAGWGLFGAVGLGGLALCWWGGRAKGRLLSRFRQGVAAPRGWLHRTAWPRSVGLGTLYGGLLLVAALIALFVADWLFPPSPAEHQWVTQSRLGDGYGTLFAVIGIILLSLLAAPVGFFTAQMTAARTAGRPSRDLVNRLVAKENAFS